MLLWLLLMLTACGLPGDDAGTFETRFSWADTAPTTDVWVSARVEQRGVDGVVKRIAETSLQRLDGNTRLDFDDVVYGERYAVVAEVWASSRPSQADTPLYFGESRVFDFRPGAHTVVRVSLDLARTPYARGDQAGKAALRIVDALDGRVTHSEVTLAIAAGNATRVVMANDLVLERGRTERRLDELVSSDGNFLWEDWDLNAACAGVTCEDGARTVYAQLLNDQGYRSEVLRTEVALDREPPKVIRATLAREPDFAPALAATEDRTLFSLSDPYDPSVSVTARLILRADEKVDLTAGPRAVGVHASGAELTWTLASPPSAASDTLQFVHEFDATASDDPGDYTLTVRWQDELGNLGSRDIPATLLLAGHAEQTRIDVDETVYRRAPWGEDATAGKPAYSVIGRMELPTQAAQVIAYRDKSATPAAEAGRADVDVNTGAFAIERLRGSDSAQLHLVAVTAAGQRSGPQPVLRGQWVASAAGKVAGSTVENPHTVESWQEAPTQLLPDDDSPYAEVGGDGLDVADGSGLRTLGAGTWKLVAKEGPRPVVGRDPDYARVYDAARGRLVASDGEYLAQWDGAQWTIARPTPSPGRRTYHGLGYDEHRGVLVMFGGMSQSVEPIDGVWEWDGRVWNEFRPPPGERWLGMAPQMAYHPLRRRMYIKASSSFMEWDGRTLRTLDPPPDTADGLVYDRVAERLTLRAGEQTWEWDDRWAPAPSTRTDMPPPYAIPPLPRATIAPSLEANNGAVPPALLAYDDAHGELLLHGASSTWAWNGAWRQVATAPSLIAMAFDRARQTMVGLSATDTWEWTGSAWNARSMAPPARPTRMAFDMREQKLSTIGWTLGAQGWTPWIIPVPTHVDEYGALIYDSRHADFAVLQGTYTYKSGLWARHWDGSSWVGTSSSVVPNWIEPRLQSAFDDEREAALVFGASTVDGNIVTAEWCREGWAILQPHRMPGPSVSGAMAYDPQKGGVYFYTNRELWRMSTARARPAHLLRVQLRPAALPDGTALENLTVRWSGGGSGQRSRTPRDGVELLVWKDGQWVAVAASEASSAAAEQLRWSLSGADALARHLYRNTVHLQARPLGANGSGTAEVFTDQVELVLEYRLP